MLLYALVMVRERDESEREGRPSLGSVQVLQ